MTRNCASINGESPSVQTHLGILQGVIQRMASNSSSCKAWCVTLVSAILVIVADKGNPDYAWIAMLPTFIFAILDAYYLALEKAFRNSYNEFIKKLHDQTITPEDLYSVLPKGSMLKLCLKSTISFSIWGFYICLALLAVIIKIVATC